MRVGERPVALNVEQLDNERREHAAVLLAWLTMESFMDDSADAMSSWHDCVSKILRDHVSFVIAGEANPEALGKAWWTEAARRAFLEFVRHNDLAPRINRHLDAMREMEQRARVES